MRYIDDLLSADNSLFEKYIDLSQVDCQDIKGIYPDFVTLNCEQEGQRFVSSMHSYFATKMFS